uniref:Uncharacterized protein n=1 Tax=Oryza sativa subsp. japonica TaxID=39947 RepID=Q6YWI2_ORYSJ|nr:hypothetical protein [Oryza sativa Japonica Group]BAD22359.1 hypothetical protein [Oryza sativa Japonica Group]
MDHPLPPSLCVASVANPRESARRVGVRAHVVRVGKHRAMFVSPPLSPGKITVDETGDSGCARPSTRSAVAGAEQKQPDC